MLPKKKKIAVTESYAEIKLQSLIDHTILRVYSSYSDFIKNHISTYTEIFALFKLTSFWDVCCFSYCQLFKSYCQLTKFSSI